MRILVADDSQLYRKMLQGLLCGWGYEVLLASDGTEALQILSSEDAPRLAILDCQMPGLGGLELCERIREAKRRYVYTILLSAADLQSDVLKGFQLGADDYLCKPFNKLELRTRLKVGELIVQNHDALAEAQQALEFEASHDSLLRTWNRRAIITLLGKELRRANRKHTLLSILLADLDLFKRVNQTHGHLVGDIVLQSVAGKIARAVRECDYFGRYEGEEFLVVLPDCSGGEACVVAERVRHSICETPAANVIEVTASIGVAQLRDGQGLSELLHQGDAALYRAKQNGRNRVEMENTSETEP
jgi:diguanylate cyclase (GGDEF)-like protein